MAEDWRKIKKKWGSEKTHLPPYSCKVSEIWEKIQPLLGVKAGEAVSSEDSLVSFKTRM